jgi:PAS domain S-box-containing protein
MNASSEVDDLRRSLRDLVALSTLPAVWRGRSSTGIAEVLSDAMHSMLSADFVYVSAKDRTGPLFEIGRGVPESDAARAAQILRPALEPHLRIDAAHARDIAHPLKPSTTARFSVVEFHLHDLHGLVGVGSTCAGFPSETDRMLLSVGANQMAIAVQQRLAEEKLEKSEQELLDFFENAVVGLHWVGPDGTILRANRAELELLGYTHDEYIGQPIQNFHADEETIVEILQDLRSGKEIHCREARLRCKDGSLRHVLISSNVLWDQGSFVHTRCFTRDITDRRKAEQNLRSQTERLQVLSDVASILLSSTDIAEMLGAVFTRITTHVPLDAFLHYAVAESGKVLTLAASAGISARTRDSIAKLEPGKGICGRVAARRQSLLCRNPAGSDGVAWAFDEGFRVYASYPLLADGLLVGTLAFASRQDETLDDQDCQLLETVCRYVAGACRRLLLLADLRERDRRKDEFLATLAHELRNPLAPLRNAVEYLNARGSLDSDCVGARRLIDRQIDHLIRLIDDLLDLSRVTRNRLELRIRRIEIAEIVRNAVDVSMPAIAESGHELTITLPDEPLYVDADLVRLAQVLTNLLNNAGKYTPRGGHIWLGVALENDQVTIRVRDTGIGIPAEKLPHVFEMFYQVDSSLERSQSGLGIGLSLVQRLVDLQKGTVEVFSAGQGSGSEFTVRLPAAAPPVASSAEEQQQIAPVPMASRRILIMDDNRDSADSLAELLRLLGNDVRVAHDGLLGVETAREFRPDVAIIDLGMPRLNGYEACRSIREQPWGKDIVLIALTGWGQEDDRRRTREAGFDAHLVKPASPDLLLRELNRPARTAAAPLSA